MSYIYPDYEPFDKSTDITDQWKKLFPIKPYFGPIVPDEPKETPKITDKTTIVADMKFDKGKLLAAIPFEDFPLAIKELIRVATFGAEKYSRSSWKTVPNASTRYNDARARHFIEVGNDEESGIDHLAHEAWNCLALLQLKLEALNEKK